MTRKDTPILPIGIESFSRIRGRGVYYVDKTTFIEELLEGSAENAVTLITRPRRFGKTLMMDTLAEFFDISKDSRELFDGLKISENTALCQKWMNQYPVIFLTLKSVEAQSYQSAEELMALIVSNFLSANRYLLESEKLVIYRERLTALLKMTAPEIAVRDSLRLLTEVMTVYWGKRAIVLIDEYDVPLATAKKHGYLQEMISLIRGFLGNSLKTNQKYLEFAVVTGCLRISRESIFTGLNNFACFTVSHTRFADKFGFTQQEVNTLLEKAELTDHLPEMQEWYDGYRFGDQQEIYCPWDVVQHVATLLDDRSAKPEAYWKNSSGNAIVREFLDMPQFRLTRKIETLLKGGCIPVNVVEEITYDELYDSEDNLWSVLYLTGYLTKASEAQNQAAGVSADSNATWLTIPNKEVMSILPSILQKRFNQQMQQSDRSSIFNAFWSSDADSLTQQLSSLLMRTISYYDYQENFYHAFLLGIFSAAGYDAVSNREMGTGRSDIVILDEDNCRAAIIEVKHADDYDHLPAEVDGALAQIVEKRYDAGIPRGYRKLLHWGIAFSEKDALAKAKQVRC